MSWFGLGSDSKTLFGNADPGGYLLEHKSAPYQSQRINEILGMSQADFNYYQQNILPIQQGLLDKALDPNTAKENVARAEADVSQQFSNAPGAFKREMAGQGIVTSAAQNADFNKQLALNRGIATAGSANSTRAATAAQASGILRGT